ncbi:MAG: hypothetical protein GYA61_04585 [Spirochaetales bacterium]|nr:hypothetical protein [Spirochaetales bacterium]
MPTPIKEKIITKGPINKSEEYIQNFWEKLPSKKNLNTKPLIQSIIGLINDAKQTIIIYSPAILLPEFLVELENAYKRNIRIYCITSSLESHNKVFQYGIMREKAKIYSSFILVDHKVVPKGVWFSGGILSDNNPDFIFNLNPQQIIELSHYFNKEFWRTGGLEIFFKKTRSFAPLEDDINNNIIVNNSSVFEDFSILDQYEIKHLILPERILENFNYYIYSKELVIELTKKAKDIIAEMDLSNSKIFATDSIKFGYMHLSNIKKDIKVIFDWDYGIILTDEQLNYIKTGLPSVQWEYHDKKKLEEILDEVILENDNWNKPNPLKIKEKGTINLENQFSNTIEEWIKNLPEPLEFKLKEYFREVTFQWLLFPPTLPNEAKKHKLYDSWDNFEKKVKEKIDKDIKDMQSFIEKLKLPYLQETKKIVKISKIKDLIDELLKIKVDKLKSLSDINEVKIEIDKIKNVREEYLNLIDQCLSEIKAAKEEDKESQKEMSEKEKSKLKELEKRRKEETNELSEIVKLKNKLEKLEPPARTLPNVGVLYEHNNNLYLLIEYIEEIDLGLKVAKEYGAKLVAKKGEK